MHRIPALIAPLDRDQGLSELSLRAQRERLEEWLGGGPELLRMESRLKQMGGSAAVDEGWRPEASGPSSNVQPFIVNHNEYIGTQMNNTGDKRRHRAKQPSMSLSESLGNTHRAPLPM